MRYKIKDFFYRTKLFFKNIRIFFKLLTNYNWYGASSGMEYFLEAWLKDIIKHYNNEEECYSVGHYEVAETAEYVLNMLEELDELNWYEEDENGKIDWESEDKARQKMMDDMFMKISKNYETWSD